ncbi:MAG: DUF4340 domain-containing protein [Phycisphaeraceae bacterium]|nr:DUF4340 domain-containing protein [Phycisphaeraceae bacterium]
MSGTKLRNLAIATAIIVGGAFFAVKGRRGNSQIPVPGAAIPGLKEKINDVASVTILKNSGSVTLARTGSGENAAWTVVAKDGFPADIERLRSTLLQLGNLELSVPQTSNAEFYPKLGVQEVAVLPKDAGDAAKKAAAPGALVELKDSAGRAIGSLIIGNAADIGNATLERPMETGQFVRRPGSTQSWLTRGTVYVDSEPMNWVDKKIVNVPRERIKGATIRRVAGTGPSSPDGHAEPDLSLSRPDRDAAAFTAAGMPPDAQLKPSEAVDQPVQAISFLSMEDVMKDPGGVIGNPDPAATGPNAAHPVVAQFETFDGLVVTVKTGFRDGKWWAHVEAEAAADALPSESKSAAEVDKSAEEKKVDAAKQAAEINKRTSGWLFAISQYDAKRLSARLDEMIAPPQVEEKPPSVGPSAEPPSPDRGTPLPPKPSAPEFPAPNPK